MCGMKKRTWDDALANLMQGNSRFLSATANDGCVSPALREYTAWRGASPYAVVVSCFDSRVVPEHIFMAGIGELITVRQFGGCINDEQIESVAWAVRHYAIPLVVVLGHTHCEAVRMAMDLRGKGKPKRALLPIAEAIGREKDEYRAIVETVNFSVRALRDHSEIESLEKKGALKILGGMYQTETGEVVLLNTGE